MEVRACGMSMEDRDIDGGAMIDTIERGSMRALAGWLKSSDQVMAL